MEEIDCLFIHPSTHYRSQAQDMKDLITFITMPMGTIAMADLLYANGYSTKIYHTGIEQVYKRSFIVEDLFSQHDPKVVGIDLHWYVHSYDAMRIADIVKKQSDAFVVIGGFTSTFFSQEIMANFDSVDAIIRGDAEIPLLELMKNLSKDTLEEVPNLTYRTKHGIKTSKGVYIADEEDLGKLDYTNFELLSNYDKYHRVTTQAGDLDPYGWKLHLKRMAWVPLGRGCTVNCSYCSGGNKGHCSLTGRDKPVYHPKEQVVSILARFEEVGIDSTYMDFDPYVDRSWYHELFEMMRVEGVDISTEFALWSLTDRAFARDFKRTFNPLYSTLVLSPESGSEDVRRRNKGFYYTNDQIHQWLETSREEYIPVEVYFASGLSGETQENFGETLELARSILEKYPIISITCNSIQMEPGGPWYIDPGRYGIRPKWKGFMDYYNLFKASADGIPPRSQLGYDTDWQTEQEILGNSIKFNEMLEGFALGRWDLIAKGEDLIKIAKV